MSVDVLSSVDVSFLLSSSPDASRLEPWCHILDDGPTGKYRQRHIAGHLAPRLSQSTEHPLLVDHELRQLLRPV